MTHPETTMSVPESITAPPGSRLHGRGTERQALDRLTADVRAGRGQALILRGEAGAGKSALHGVELRHLRYFVAVADAGTFTQAAERMFIAQPTLSQQVRRLEEMVGTPLLQRGREGVRLTKAGAVLLEEARTLLTRVERGVSLTRQAAGIGRPRLRVAVSPGMPEALAAAALTRLRDIAAGAGVEVAWLEAVLDPDFTLVGQHRADAGLGWLAPAGQPPPEPLEVMSLGDFEPEAWIPAACPAARRDALGLGDLARLTVVHGPRRASPGTYDAWLACLRSADPRFAFADPPFRQSLPLTLAFAAAASRPTAVLTGPRHPAGQPAAGDDQAADGCAMVRARLDQAPLTASAGLVWNGDLPRPLQQILFDLADGINLHMTTYPEPTVIPPPSPEAEGQDHRPPEATLMAASAVYA